MAVFKEDLSKEIRNAIMRSANEYFMRGGMVLSRSSYISLFLTEEDAAVLAKAQQIVQYRGRATCTFHYGGAGDLMPITMTYGADANALPFFSPFHYNVVGGALSPVAEEFIAWADGSSRIYHAIRTALGAVTYLNTNCGGAKAFHAQFPALLGILNDLQFPDYYGRAKKNLETGRDIAVKQITGMRTLGMLAPISADLRKKVYEAGTVLNALRMTTGAPAVGFRRDEVLLRPDLQNINDLHFPEIAKFAEPDYP